MWKKKKKEKLYIIQQCLTWVQNWEKTYLWIACAIILWYTYYQVVVRHDTTWNDDTSLSWRILAALEEYHLLFWERKILSYQETYRMAASNTEENYLKIVSTSLPRAYIKCIICIKLCCSSKFSEMWFSLRLMKLVIPMESEILAFSLFSGFSFSNQTTSGYDLSELRS